MTFQFSERHIDEYHRLGYTVFQSILPDALVVDLRRVTDRARQIARDRAGSQTQRLQPVGEFELEQQPFVDYTELPVLVDALARVLTPHHRPGGPASMGVLLEPSELSYCTQWHRDWRDNISGLDLSSWDSVSRDIDFFNQVNCALYADSCTWFVPGSHLRRDLPREVARFPDRPICAPDLEGRSATERERLCLEYCRSMPAAVQIHLEAGDYALYRNTLWHIGNYVPYRKRATLHDFIDTPAYAKWRQQEVAGANQRREAGKGMENPNRDR
jgi:hypothetical protein